MNINYETSVQQEPETQLDSYNPSPKEREIVQRVVTKFRNTADRRNQNFQFFDGLTLLDYVSDSVDRYVTNVYERDGIEDWQARAHNPFTRNKVTTILGKAVQELPIAAFSSIGEDNPLKGRVLSDVYVFSEEIDDYEDFMVRFLQEAIVKGTAIGYEGHIDVTRKIRKKSGGTIKSGVEKVSKIYSQVVPIEEFYPASVGITHVKDQPYCFWRKVWSYEDFLTNFKMYDAHKDVRVDHGEYTDENRPFYLDYMDNDIGENNVEVIIYYSKTEDEYVIIANGVWLNPFKTKSGNLLVEPLPFEHKDLPFWDIKFEYFGADFFYGKSLADKLKSMQDVLDVLMNMLLDQSFLTIFPPMLTAGFDDIEDDYIRPGRRTPVDTQGLSIKDQYVLLDQGTPGSWHQFILNYTEKVMEQASVDSVTSGQAGVGDRTTAKEISRAAEGVESVLGMFSRLVRVGLKRKAMLRAKLIMQYWTRASHPVLYNSMAKNEGKVLNVFKLSDSIMTGGKRGRKVIEMYAKKDDMPTRSELKARQKVFEAESGSKIEIVAIPARWIRNTEFEVTTIMNPRREKSKELHQGLVLEKVRVYKSFFPNLVDDEYLLEQVAEAFDDDPTKVVKQQQQQGGIPGLPQAPGQGNPEQDSGVNQNPEMNIANNIARSARGGESQSSAMAMLMNGMQ